MKISIFIAIIILNLNSNIINCQSTNEIFKKQQIEKLAKEIDVYDHIDFTNYEYGNTMSIDFWKTWFICIKAQKEIEQLSIVKSDQYDKYWNSYAEKSDNENYTRHEKDSLYSKFKTKVDALNLTFRKEKDEIEEKYNLKENYKIVYSSLRL